MKNISILSCLLWKMRGVFLFIKEISINFKLQYASKITSVFPYLSQWDAPIPGHEKQAHKGLLMARHSAFLILKTDSMDRFVQKYVLLLACKMPWMGKHRQDEEFELIWTVGKPSGFTALPVNQKFSRSFLILTTNALQLSIFARHFSPSLRTFKSRVF